MLLSLRKIHPLYNTSWKHVRIFNIIRCPFMLTKFVINNKYCYNISAVELGGKAKREYDILQLNDFYTKVRQFHPNSYLGMTI